jgi:hypothetical protein
VKSATYFNFPVATRDLVMWSECKRKSRDSAFLEQPGHQICGRKLLLLCAYRNMSVGYVVTVTKSPKTKTFDLLINLFLTDKLVNIPLACNLLKNSACQTIQITPLYDCACNRSNT